MDVLLINPPYWTLASKLGAGHQVPLGLLAIGGPLLAAGHEVRLLDAEQKRLKISQVVRAVIQDAPQVVMAGHAGSTPAHPVCMQMLRAIKDAAPEVLTVYGGVYPTFHADRILKQESAVDIIVRGEGEATACALIAVLETDSSISILALEMVAGISYRQGKQVIHNPDRPPIFDLDAYRVGWELIDNWEKYQCFGLGRAAIVQFSRGCPHRCTYCGQHDFWVKWRHRDPIKFAAEIEWLHRAHRVRFFTMADENPATLPSVWKQLLDEIIARKLPVHFFVTVRATDIVRDQDILPLYQRAGVLYVLMGIESTNPDVLKEIRKNSTVRNDYEACRLLKENKMYSVLGHVVGLDNDSWASLRKAKQNLQRYDGDYLNAMYITPHSWTQFSRDVGSRRVIQNDQSKWDYRHQVLEHQHLKTYQLFFYVKWLELCFHLRWRVLHRILFPNHVIDRQQRLWSLSRTGVVWVAEVIEFVFSTFFPRVKSKLSEVRKPSRISKGRRL